MALTVSAISGRRFVSTPLDDGAFAAEWEPDALCARSYLLGDGEFVSTYGAEQWARVSRASRLERLGLRTLANELPRMFATAMTCTRRNIRRPRTVGDLIGDDVAALPADASWGLAWDLLMNGPFIACLVAHDETYRLATADALVRSAFSRRTGPDAPLVGSDFQELPAVSSTEPLGKTASRLIELGWSQVLVRGAEPKVVSSRELLRALADEHLGLWPLAECVWVAQDARPG